MTFSELLKETESRLRPVAGEDARFEGMLILSHIFDMEDIRPFLYYEADISETQRNELDSILTRRLKHEPLQYILGVWEFMGNSFYVRKNVLIPRPDTEILVMEASRLIQENGYKTVLDLCCGTGCIGITLSLMENVDVTLSDISDDALYLAELNTEKNGVDLVTVESDLFEKFQGHTFDMIVSNPPYLNKKEMENLQPEVRYEPELALYGGEDGLDYYRRIGHEYKNYLNDNGKMLLEIGYMEAEAVSELFPGSRILNDYGNRPRVLVAGK